MVINYASLEGAARTLQPILAVAMEFSSSPASGPRRIVKFYTYAPTRAGDFPRVLSVDLDGRARLGVLVGEVALEVALARTIQ